MTTTTTTTKTTDRNLQTIRDFLRLPVTALPSACMADPGDDDLGLPAWTLLRDYARDPAGATRWNAKIILHADRPGWRGQVVVTV